MNFRLKKLDLLLLKSFMGPFLITSVLVVFTFIMQFYWLYMDDLIGKGLGVGMMFKLLFYMIPTVLPLALPLIVMLSSIMTLGNLGEHFELIAIKASGISLFRFIRPLFAFIIVLAIGAFFLNNNILPVANLKAYSLLYDMRNQKPTSNFVEGVFNYDIKDIAIRIDKKDKNGLDIEGVLIYDHTKGDGNTNIVVSEKGKMYSSPGGKYLVFELHNGWRHEEKKDRRTDEVTRMHFDKWYINFDLSEFAFERSDEGQFQGREDMMDLQQLNASIDTFNQKYEKNYESILMNVQPYLSFLKQRGDDTIIKQKIASSKLPLISYDQSILEKFTLDTQRNTAIENAFSGTKNVERSISVILHDVAFNRGKINSYEIAVNNKFTLSIACIILFFIGAPLGAIIRKGGLGMPVLVAIIFFLIYFILNNAGMKLAEQMEVKPWQGMWMANVILVPIAVFIMVKARNDSNLFNKELYLRAWAFIKKKWPFGKKKK